MLNQEININGLKINYKVAGEGQPLLIVHGWGGSTVSWEKVQEILSKNNLKVICFDLPGFGKSSNPNKPWGTDEYIKFIADFSKAIGLNKFFLLGHSFGGGLAVKFSASFPEKVIALILCNAAVIRTNKKLNFRQKISYFITKISYAILPDSFLNKRFYPLIRKLIYKIAGVNDYYLAQGVMKETFKIISTQDLTEFALKIKAPTLIIWGKDDKTLPLDDGIVLKKIIPNSQIEIIEKAGHSPHRKKPQELSEIIIKFLKSKL